MHLPFLDEIVIVLAASVVVAIVLRRFSIPPVVGFILTGIAIGPGGLGIIDDRTQIELLAEVGVILLLFTVGLKLSLRDLWQLRRLVLGGGGGQVVLTAAAGAGILLLAGSFSPPTAIFWGLVIALSSTVVVLWLLEDRGELGSDTGRSMISVLLFQDLAVIPILLALPLLSGQGGSGMEVILVVVRSLVALVLTVVGAKFILPRLAGWAVSTRSRELFTLTIVVVVFGTAAVMGHLGISMALGAFLAGMVISESDYTSQIIADVTPLRDAFNSLFFVSMGMLVDPSLWLEQPLLIVAGIAGVILVKAGVAAAVALVVLRSVPAALATGLGLAQIGEFSVIVLQEATRIGLVGDAERSVFLALVVPSMLLTPVTLALGQRLKERLRAWSALDRLHDRIGARSAEEVAMGTFTDDSLSDHVVIIGYGVNGQNVARALKLMGIEFVIVDMNPYTVRTLREAGTPALWGDSRREPVLRQAGVQRARAVVVAIPDAASTRETVACARRCHPTVPIVARTRYLREVEALEELGADEVIPEEFETSIELTARVLARYGASQARIVRETAALRQRHYGVLRGPHSGDALLPALDGLLAESHIESLTVPTSCAGATLGELDVRRHTGATVLAIQRNGETSSNPGPDETIVAGDTLVVLATAEQLQAIQGLLADRPAGALSRHDHAR